MNGFWVDCVIIGVQYALYGDLTVNMRFWGLCRLLSTFFFFFFFGLDYIFQFLVNLVWILWGRNESKPASSLFALGPKDPHGFIFCKRREQYFRLAPASKKDAPHSYFINLSWRQECTTTSVVVEYIYIYIHLLHWRFWSQI